MNWQADITKTREAHLRAVLAEYARDWHLVIRDYLYCLEAAERAGDVRAVGFFAAKLAAAYRAIGLGRKRSVTVSWRRRLKTKRPESKPAWGRRC